MPTEAASVNQRLLSGPRVMPYGSNATAYFVIFSAVALGVALGVAVGAGVCVASGVGVADVVAVAVGSGLGVALAACVGFGDGVVGATGPTGTEVWAQPAIEAASANAIGKEHVSRQIESLRTVMPSCGQRVRLPVRAAAAGPRLKTSEPGVPAASARRAGTIASLLAETDRRAALYRATPQDGNVWLLEAVVVAAEGSVPSEAGVRGPPRRRHRTFAPERTSPS